MSRKNRRKSRKQRKFVGTFTEVIIPSDIEARSAPPATRAAHTSLPTIAIGEFERVADSLNVSPGNLSTMIGRASTGSYSGWKAKGECPKYAYLAAKCILLERKRERLVNQSMFVCTISPDKEAWLCKSLELVGASFSKLEVSHAQA